MGGPGQLRVVQEQERMEAEWLAELDRRVEREKVPERLRAAMARGLEAEHERPEGETASRHQRTQETLKAIRDEAVRVEAARIARSFGARLAEEDGTLAAKVRTFILDPRTAWTTVRRHASLRLPRGEPVRARRALRERVGASGAARRSVDWWPAGHGSSSLCFRVDCGVDVSVASVAVLCASCGRSTSGARLCVTRRRKSKSESESKSKSP